MSTIEMIHSRLVDLATDAHQVACGLEIGKERTEAFELYEALRRLQRKGAAREVLAATNPLLAAPAEDDDEDDWWDEEDD